MNLDPIIEKLAELEKRRVPLEQWATVTATSPLTVQPDGQGPVAAINLIGTLAVDDRVRVRYMNDQLFAVHKVYA